MVGIETYPCYVRIGESAGAEDIVELPTETDGTLLLSTITAQFPDAIGLRFKSDSGAWRGVRVTSGILDVPLEGWGDKEYYITVSKAGEKRKAEDDSGPKSKKEMLQDLIVLGLPYSSTEDDIKEYFSQFGELAHWEIKVDKQTGKSKGFGFIRFTDVDSVEKVLDATHSIGGRKCEVQFPKRERQQQNFGGQQDGIPTKLFIGRLPRGATTEDLKDCFSHYGPLKDVYIPSNFRGFGFVTFPSQSAAYAALNTSHVIKGSTLNVTHPAPKPGEQNTQNVPMQMQQQHYGYSTMSPGGSMHGHIQGNMQGNMAGNMPGNIQQMPMQQQGGWYGNQGQKGNNGYYTQGYFQSGGKVQGGKPV